MVKVAMLLSCKTVSTTTVKGGLLRGLSLRIEVLAHNRGMEPPAQPRLVAGDLDAVENDV